jgi:hypothetical protein
MRIVDGTRDGFCPWERLRTQIDGIYEDSSILTFESFEQLR